MTLRLLRSTQSGHARLAESFYFGPAPRLAVVPGVFRSSPRAVWPWVLVVVAVAALLVVA